MKDKILATLQNLERERDIKILFAGESGSRAWGFASPDSDYDIRLIYVHQLDWYLNIGTPKDTINWMDETRLIDVAGWELKKTLQLGAKSNVSPFEWIQSPIIYRANENFVSEFKAVLTPCFSPIKAMHHYLSMSRKIAALCASSEPQKLKKWFYGLRTALNCLWIAAYKSVPPIQFEDTFVLLENQPELKARIQDLMVIKMREDETYFFEGDTVLAEFMELSIKKCDAIFKTLPAGNGSLDEINTLLRKWVKH